MLFALFLLKFATATIDSNFRPPRLPADIFTAYLEARARMRRISAAFPLCVFSFFANKEPAFVASFILFHFAPHDNMLL